MFAARFANRCANGHQIEIGDTVAFNDDGQILCVKCPTFGTRHEKTVIYSNKFCGKCHLELAMDGTCGNC